MNKTEVWFNKGDRIIGEEKISCFTIEVTGNTEIVDSVEEVVVKLVTEKVAEKEGSCQK